LNTRLVVQGRVIEAQWWGAPLSERIPIVLLHEGLGSVAMWRDFPRALAERTDRRVLAYSRFGHGESDPPARRHTIDFMHEEARLVPEVLDAAGIDRAILAGHSDGGSIAIIAAAEASSFVAGLVLEAPHVFVEGVSLASIERMKRHWATTNLRDRLAQYHRNVDAAFHGWSDVWLDPAFKSWNLEAFLSRISCPALLIQGDLDEYGTLHQIEAIERQLTGPTRRLILRECGHSPHRDRPEAVIGAIARLAADVDHLE
jgi:pimeloyl-ACP methyl ester carboxylesterase